MPGGLVSTRCEFSASGRLPQVVERESGYPGPSGGAFGEFSATESVIMAFCYSLVSTRYLR
jgi:hypothetical protein